MADDATPDTTPEGTGQPEGGQGGSLDARMGKLEATQAEQGTKLDRILDLLPGKSSSDDAPASADTGAPAPDIQSQVRAEIAATKAREAEEARAKGDADWRQSVEAKLEELKPEKTPRDAQPGWRGRLQRAMFGDPD
jgi:hypothetical protein